MVAVSKWKSLNLRSTRLAMRRTTKNETVKIAQNTQSAFLPIIVRMRVGKGSATGYE